MTFKTWSRVGLPTLLMAAAVALPVLAQTAAPAPDAVPAVVGPSINKGDTTWMLTSALLVLMMSVPGLALFYGGLVRTKNMLSVLMQVIYSVCIVGIIWVLYGYSLAFTGGSDFIGGFAKAFLSGVTTESAGGTFSVGVAIPELAFVAFQMTFAMITPALIIGAFAERVKFSAIVLFIPLWVTFIYFPMAHMVWYWAGPDAVDAAAKALAAATDGAAKTAAQEALDAVLADAGYIYKLGALDFAGGTVVHINAGIAALVGCFIVGKRTGYGREQFSPHSLTLTLVGAGLLWVGWFGFNAGSNLEANGLTALAMMNTFIATCAAALSWMIIEWLAKGKPSMLGVVSGAIAGLVAVTPMAGFAGIMGAMISGLIVGVVCFFFCTTVKNAFGYDDSLDVFGVHGVGGIFGAIATGIVVSPALGGTGVFDYTTGAVAEYNMATQVMAQLKAVGVTLVWSGVGSAILFYIVNAVVGLRASVEKEREGLDITEHGERAYHS
ncbi:ammonium transporter [Aquabacter spiritensis]|uniref:Ammonium transporter n=1 Tax=Aquabacter spiritensis TaxID=933073 RepID=A0A4R3LZW5_9HYPH|nr:ammonium transporter [Aquabacter spiritensis]TCT06003.1 ammonium transporter [Aquabacter spiritensis]